LTLAGLFVVVAYPVGDLAVLGVLIRLLLQGSGNTSLRFITISLALFLFGDLCWAISSRFEFILEGLKLRLLESVFLTAYVLMGAAAVHPSSRNIIKPIPVRPPGVSLSLLIVLAITSLVPSALLLYQAQSGAVTNGIAISISSGGLFLLVIIRVVGLLRKVESQAEQLNTLSRIDELTGLYNRRAWLDSLHLTIERARRAKAPFTVALLDLDFFKKFNDSFGHQAGDKLLQSVANAWQSTIRKPDILGRYGGEEFILLLPDTNLETANNVLERLRAVVPENQTFSSGLALWDGSETIEHLLLRIDQALYRAKEQGRNRTVLAE
jgi:diguanylate cyclase (GGDEF)-like protein